LKLETAERKTRTALSGISQGFDLERPAAIHTLSSSALHIGADLANDGLPRLTSIIFL
jgi:hypothetical protein